MNIRLELHAKCVIIIDNQGQIQGALTKLFWTQLTIEKCLCCRLEFMLYNPSKDWKNSAG